MDDLAAETTGAGRDVVLVHAGVADRRMWDAQLRTYSRRFRVVGYDLRGFGDSPIAPGSYSHARDLIRLLDRFVPQRAALVGVSLGGRVALEVAAAAPERVWALVLVGAALPDYAWSDELTRFGQTEEAAFERGDLDTATELNVRRWLGPGASEEARELVRSMQRRAFELQLPVDGTAVEEPLMPDISSRLADVAAPTLVVTGEDDARDFAEIGDRLAREIPGATRATVPGAAHLPPLERPDEFDALVLPFLRERAPV